MEPEEELEPTQTQTQSQTQKSQLPVWVNDDNDLDIWGRLYAKNANLRNLGIRKRPVYVLDNSSGAIDLTNDTFTAGRANTNDFCFTVPEVSAKVVCQLSKVHFKIMRDLSDAHNPPYIEDLSRNGTYINREKLGLKRKRILAHNDVISVSNPAYKTFVYKDQRRNLYDLPEVITSKYHVGRKLGAGASGTVYHVHNYQTCNAYALKHIKKNLLVDLKTEKAMNEAKIMKSLKHPCVVQMNDIIDTPDSVFIMLELMHGGDLLTRIQRCSYLSEDLSKLSFYQICHAIKYLHDRNVTHRDLKPDNILLATKDDETLVKVSDFGLSKLVQNNSVMKTLCGTPLYVAPEVLQTNGRGEYSEKVDVWSLGVVLFTCLSGTLPFANEYGSPATEQIKHGRFKFISPNWKNVSEVAKKFVCEILTIDVEKRPSIDKVLQHPWLADDYGMLCKAHKLMDLPPPPAPIVKIPRARIIDRQTIFAKPKPFEVGKISSELTNIIENSPLQLQPPPKRRRLC